MHTDVAASHPVPLHILSSQQSIRNRTDYNYATQANKASYKSSVVEWPWRGTKDHRTDYVSNAVSDKGSSANGRFLCSEISHEMVDDVR